MLNRLSIKNVALIDSAEIEFDCGLNVLSGETGSGKSVILDSINFVLGSKADKSMVRFGESESLVKAEFSIGDNIIIKNLLSEFDIECDDCVVISRKFSVDGRGSIKINGESATVGMLKTLSQHLVDVHGQSEHFFLLNTANQLKVIDMLAGASVVFYKEELSQLISRKKLLKEKLMSLGGSDFEREQRIDVLSYQINEIDKAEVKVGEFDELKARQSVIINAEKILVSLNTIKQIFDEDNCCNDLISQAVRQMSSLTSISGAYNKIADKIADFQAEAYDIVDEISSLADDVTFDEEEAVYLEERLALIKSLIKKYGGSEEAILEFRETAEKELDTLVNSVDNIKDINNKLEKLDEDIYSVCKKITKTRKKVAETFCGEVEKELITLNIPHACFVVNFNEYEVDNANLNSINGADEIEFMFSANKGEPLKPLNKVISGGEMSRFMLAIKTKVKDVNGISTYIFDEIDAGISGFTANAVAEKFLKIADETQIIAVSHLPQICAASDSQFLIYKTETAEKTFTRVKLLTNDEKIEEIVRLTGNVSTDAAREHAKELINNIKFAK